MAQQIRGSQWCNQQLIRRSRGGTADQNLTLMEELSSKSHLSRTSDPSLTLLKQLITVSSWWNSGSEAQRVEQKVSPYWSSCQWCYSTLRQALWSALFCWIHLNPSWDVIIVKNKTCSVFVENHQKYNKNHFFLVFFSSSTSFVLKIYSERASYKNKLSIQ